jgi:3-methyladenine DNA glycosylase/8-oxoguanine DNA glycosylase
VLNHLFNSIILSTKAVSILHGRFTKLLDSEKIDFNQLLELDKEILKSFDLSYKKAKCVNNVTSYFAKPYISVMDWISMDDEVLFLSSPKEKE